MADEVLEVEAIEEPAGQAGEGDATVNRLPQRREGGELDIWRGEAKTVALAAAGGLAAGAATVAAVRAVGSRGARRRSRGLFRRRGEREGIVASRSFLIDVHVLGR